MLPKALVPELQNDIVYNARVTRVEHGDGPVVAHYQSIEGKDESVSGDYLLTTATATATSLIEFIPSLDYEKQEALRGINYNGATKIALIFQKPFWEDEGIFGGHTTTDLPSRSIYYPSHKFESGLGVIIASYVHGDQSDMFLSLTEEECFNQTLTDLAQIHGEYIKDLYIEGVVKRWSLDPYSLGAYAWFNPYQLANLWVPLVRPTENIFFAGEHTNFVHAWIDTAVRSAVEAVNCISTNNCYPELDYVNWRVSTTKMRKTGISEWLGRLENKGRRRQ